MNHREIAEKLMQAQKESKKSFGDLSQETGIPRSIIYRYFSGETETIPIERLKALCEALGLDINHLLGWETKEDILKEAAAKYRTLTPQEEVLLDASEDLTEYERTMVMNMIETLKKMRTIDK